MFVRADVLRRLGGFPDQPLMEDIELLSRLNWVGPRIVFEQLPTLRDIDTAEDLRAVARLFAPLRQYR
jgi:hypothetical protein